MTNPLIPQKLWTNLNRPQLSVAKQRSANREAFSYNQH